MGAWGYRILENDEALDTMDELNKMLDNPLIKENICYRIEYLLNSSENLDDILLCIGLIDASINGTDVNILGSYDYYNNLFNYIKTKPMYNLNRSTHCSAIRKRSSTECKTFRYTCWLG